MLSAFPLVVCVCVSSLRCLFTALSHCLGMEPLVKSFYSLIADFQSKNKSDLLDFENAVFERDFVEFTMRNSLLESAIQDFMLRSVMQVVCVCVLVVCLGFILFLDQTKSSCFCSLRVLSSQFFPLVRVVALLHGAAAEPAEAFSTRPHTAFAA